MRLLTPHNDAKNRRGKQVEILKSGSDALFILLGAIMVLAMHAGFAFLELGTVRKKNQVNALVKIDRKSTRLNSSHSQQSRMPSSA